MTRIFDFAAERQQRRHIPTTEVPDGDKLIDPYEVIRANYTIEKFRLWQGESKELVRFGKTDIADQIEPRQLLRGGEWCLGGNGVELLRRVGITNSSASLYMCFYGFSRIFKVAAEGDGYFANRLKDYRAARSKTEGAADPVIGQTAAAYALAFVYGDPVQTKEVSVNAYEAIEALQPTNNEAATVPEDEAVRLLGALARPIDNYTRGKLCGYFDSPRL